MEPLALQDRLRKIISKLLNTQRFREWMSAMEKTSRQERLAALKGVASKLPEANLLLLLHLLSLLSSISRNVATTKTTAENLAICLAPNLLSPPDYLPLDVLALETGKVTQVVEFLIDHYEELFGEQVAGLASEGDEETLAPQAELEYIVQTACSSQCCFDAFLNFLYHFYTDIKFQMHTWPVSVFE
ncbi:T-cell activation Rho GTPase-activating protein-like [Neopsephotus bourkii]|uniref:T-cell activation Rho GTPase-activating protein-like n=1 Tax=Neopsephotus bourkii TaxID=309878 RepID=UPI002AA58C7C|nr:T-cell activation Rho GTPase-activating protein-like [Neopsephotus bourkii]